MKYQQPVASVDGKRNTANEKKQHFYEKLHKAIDKSRNWAINQSTNQAIKQNMNANKR